MRWAVFALRGCNIEGGEVIREYLSRMEVPLALLQQQHQKESGFPAGGAQGGWRRSGGGSFYFQIHNSNIDIQSSQHLVRQLGRLVRNL